MLTLVATGDSTAERLGAAVRQLLGGVSQAELARRLGVDPSVVSRLVNGKAPFSHEDVANIEDALNLTPGTVAVVAGLYAPGNPMDVQTQLLIDECLSPEDRELLARLYERARLRGPDAGRVGSVANHSNDGNQTGQ